MATPALIEDLASKVHDECLAAPSDHLFTTSQLQGMVPGKHKTEVHGQVINLLLQTYRLTPLVQGAQTVFKAISKEQQDKFRNMNDDEKLLYGYIEEAGREGIWTKALKTKSGMHITSQNKALKSLEHKRYIKAVKSVKFPTKKVYMLYELTPSVEVSGGPWYTDNELDLEFVGELLTAIRKHITSRSFPRPPRDAPKTVANFPPDYTGYPTITDVYKWVKNSGLTDVQLAEGHIKNLLDVLMYDGHIERVVGGTAWRAVRRPEAISGFTESPCARCPVFSLCAEGGPVSASNCKYFEDWLNQEW